MEQEEEDNDEEDVNMSTTTPSSTKKTASRRDRFPSEADDVNECDGSWDQVNKNDHFKSCCSVYQLAGEKWDNIGKKHDGYIELSTVMSQHNQNHNRKVSQLVRWVDKDTSRSTFSCEVVKGLPLRRKDQLFISVAVLWQLNVHHHSRRPPLLSSLQTCLMQVILKQRGCG